MKVQDGAASVLTCKLFSLQAAQTDDLTKTAGAVVFVTIEDVNDNVPEFDQPSYSLTLLENSPDGAVVFKATVTDKDQVDFLLHITLHNDVRHLEVITPITCSPRVDLRGRCRSFQSRLPSPSDQMGRSQLRTPQLWTERPRRTSHFR